MGFNSITYCTKATFTARARHVEISEGCRDSQGQEERVSRLGEQRDPSFALSLCRDPKPLPVPKEQQRSACRHRLPSPFHTLLSQRVRLYRSPFSYRPTSRPYSRNSEDGNVMRLARFHSVPGTPILTPSSVLFVCLLL